MSFCSVDGLNVYDPIPTQIGAESSYWASVKPNNNNYNESTLTFDWGASDQYTDLGSPFILAEIVVLAKRENENAFSQLKATDPMSVANDALSASFSKVTPLIQDQAVEDRNSNYAYRAYLEDLSNLSSEAKRTFMEAGLFIEDTPGNFENFQITPDRASADFNTVTALTDLQVQAVTGVNQGLAPVATALQNCIKAINGAVTSNVGIDDSKLNKGWLSRRQKFIDNTTVQVLAYLHCDLFHTNKYLPNGIDLKVNMTRSPQSFVLLGDVTNKTEYKIEIRDITMYIRRIKVSQDVQLHHAMELEKQNIRIPLKRVVVTDRFVPKDLTSYTIQNLNQGQLPTRIQIGLIDNEAFKGTINKNPFFFQHAGLISILPIVAEQNIPYQDPIEPNYTENKFLLPYHGFLNGIDPTLPFRGNNITPFAYKNGNCLYSFNLTADDCAGPHKELKKEGDIHIKLVFGTKTDKAYTAIILKEYDNEIQITKQKQVIQDYKN